MQIAEFQWWVKNIDRHTQWDLLTGLHLISHLTEEVGELAQVLNRIYDDSGEKEKHLANLRSELVDVYWLLNKIANKYDVELDIEVQDFVQRAKSGLPEKYRHELLARLQALDQELAVAKSALGQNLQRGEDKGCTV